VEHAILFLQLKLLGKRTRVHDSATGYWYQPDETTPLCEIQRRCKNVFESLNEELQELLNSSLSSTSEQTPSIRCLESLSCSESTCCMPKGAVHQHNPATQTLHEETQHHNQVSMHVDFRFSFCISCNLKVSLGLRPFTPLLDALACRTVSSVPQSSGCLFPLDSIG
jgi:hypothetical protein